MPPILPLLLPIGVPPHSRYHRKNSNTPPSPYFFQSGRVLFARTYVASNVGEAYMVSREMSRLSKSKQNCPEKLRGCGGSAPALKSPRYCYCVQAGDFLQKSELSAGFGLLLTSFQIISHVEVIVCNFISIETIFQKLTVELVCEFNV